jgi:hypothetical protein
MLRVQPSAADQENPCSQYVYTALPSVGFSAPGTVKFTAPSSQEVHH